MSLSELKTRYASKKAQQRTDATRPADVGTQELPLFKIRKDAEGNFKDVQILQTGFLEKLRTLGFRRYDINESFIIVRIQDNIIEQVPIHRLRELIVRHFWEMDAEYLQAELSCPKDALFEKLLRSLGSLLTDDKLSLLVDMNNDGTTIQLVMDSIDKGYYFFKNGFIEVTKSGYELRPYMELPGYIWRDQIISRDFKKMTLKEIEAGVYWKFANNVAGNADGKNPARFSSFLTITGYNLHRFFETKLRCTIFLDARMSDDPDGRSGKSLHCKAMRQIMNADPVNGKQFITIDGKTFDTSNRFCLDQLDISTRVVVFDDIKRGFVIEDFFNSIVDGLIRERKGDVFKARILAKIIFTLNYTIQIRGGSARDRVIEFEFADYYSASHTPEQEFGQWFFRDWDEIEYQRFDNFMITCIMEYLRCGVIMPDTVNLEARKLRDETAQEFIDWMDTLEITHEIEFDKKDLYRKWMDFDNDNNIRNIDFKWMKPRVFTKWLTIYATYRPEIAGYRSRRSSGRDYIQYFHNRAVAPDILADSTFPPVFFEGKSDRVKGGVADDKLPF